MRALYSKKQYYCSILLIIFSTLSLKVDASVSAIDCNTF